MLKMHMLVLVDTLGWLHVSGCKTADCVYVCLSLCYASLALSVTVHSSFSKYDDNSFLCFSAVWSVSHPYLAAATIDFGGDAGVR